MKSERAKAKKKLDVIFSKFIRLRDKGKPCISCGKIGVDLEDGHFIPRAHTATRWCEKNNNGQCKHCNWTLEGNVSEYRKSMVNMHGEQFVEMIERDKNKPCKISTSEINILIEHYKNKIKDMREKNESNIK